jgi:hypothetical protein
MHPAAPGAAFFPENHGPVRAGAARARDFDFFHDFLSAARLVVRILNRQKHARQFRAARLPSPSCRTMTPLPPLKRN